jgi:hypothetical protein
MYAEVVELSVLCMPTYYRNVLLSSAEAKFCEGGVAYSCDGREQRERRVQRALTGVLGDWREV